MRPKETGNFAFLRCVFFAHIAATENESLIKKHGFVGSQVHSQKFIGAHIRPRGGGPGIDPSVGRYRKWWAVINSLYLKLVIVRSTKGIGEGPK